MCLNFKYTLCIFATLLVYGYSLNLPASFKRCKVSDPNLKECIKEATYDAVQKLKHGNKELKLLPLDPLSLDGIKIPRGNGNIRIDQEYKNIKIHGLTEGKVLAVHKLEIGPNGMEMDMDTESTTVELVGDYTLTGRVSLLPLTGSGKCNITMLNMVTKHKMSGEMYQKKAGGKSYVKITKYTVEFIPKKVVYVFENLFNGDPALGIDMNGILNQNSEQVFNELKQGYEETFGLAFQSFANRVFQHVPIDKIFIF